LEVVIKLKQALQMTSRLKLIGNAIKGTIIINKRV